MRLVDFHYEQLNAMYDTLPLRGKLAIIRGRFDAWVKGGGSVECGGCRRIVRELGGKCDECFVSEESENG